MSCLGLLGRQAADALEGLHLFVPDARELVALLVELLITDEQLAIALLEHVRALVELLVALQQAAFEVLQVDALGAALLVDLTLDPDLLLLGLEDQVLLLGSRLGDDAFGLLVGGLDRLVGDEAARHETDGKPADSHHQDDDRHDDGVVHFSLPSSQGPDVNQISGYATAWWLSGVTPYWCRSTVRGSRTRSLAGRAGASNAASRRPRSGLGDGRRRPRGRRRGRNRCVPGGRRLSADAAGVGLAAKREERRSRAARGGREGRRVPSCLITSRSPLGTLLQHPAMIVVRTPLR